MAPIDQAAKADDLALLISLYQEGHHLIKGHYTSKLISYVCLKHSTCVLSSNKEYLIKGHSEMIFKVC